MSVRLVLSLAVTAVILICVKGNEEYAPSPRAVRVIRPVKPDQPGNLNDTENTKIFLDGIASHFLMPLSKLSRLCGNFVNGGGSAGSQTGSASSVYDSVESDSSSSSSSDECQGFSVYEPADTNPTSNLGTLIHQFNNHGVKIPHQNPNNNGNYGGGQGGGGYHGNNGGNYMGNNNGNYGHGTNNANYGNSADTSNGNYGNNGGNYGGNGHGTYNGNYHSNNNNHNGNYQNNAEGSYSNGHGNGGNGYDTNNGHYNSHNSYYSGYYDNGADNGNYGGNGYGTNNGNYDISSDSSDHGNGNYGTNNKVKKPKGSHTTVDVSVHVLTAFFKDPDTKKILADYDETRFNDEDAVKNYIGSQTYNHKPPKCLHRGLNAMRLLEGVKLTDEGRFFGFLPHKHCQPFMNVIHDSNMQRPY